MPMTMPKQMPYFQDDDMPEGVATGVMADFSHFSSAERLERAAVLDERMPLARELHDGALQSLSAATLQLETLSRLRVVVTVSDRQAFPRTLGDEVYRLVRKRSATSPDTRMLVSPASR